MVGQSIWVLNHYTITPDMPGGSRHFDLGKELVKRGHEVVIFASGFDHGSRTYVKVKSKEKLRRDELDGVQFVWLNTYPYVGNNWRRVLNMFSYGLGVLGAARDLKGPDAVIGSSLHPVAALAGWWLARRHKARFIFEVRDLWPQTAIGMGAMEGTSLMARLLYAWEKFLCDRAEKIVVLMPGARQYFESRGVDPRKIHWIPNGVDLERYCDMAPLAPSTEGAQAFQKHKDKFKVIYAGAHGSANGLDVAIEAAAMLKERDANIHFIFIGDGPEKRKRQIAPTLPEGKMRAGDLACVFRGAH